MNKLALCFLLFAFTAFYSCSEDETSSETINNTTEFSATYTDNTVVLDSNELSYYVSLDTANQTYYFIPNEKINNIKVGQILLIYRQAIIKVKSKFESNGKIAIVANKAKLTDAIKNGKIAWNHNCGFNPKGMTIKVKDKEYYPKILSDDILEWEFKIAPYTYYIKMSAKTSYAEVKLSITKDIGDKVKGTFTAEGVIQQFQTSSDIEIQDSKMIKFDHQNRNLEGDLKLSLTVAASGSDALNFDFPVPLFKYPIMVGPIPVIVNLSAKFVVNAVVPLDGSSQVSAKFKYNSVTGFTYNGYDVDASANVGPFTISKDVNQTGASGAISANFGIAFPRLELDIFNETVVPYIQTAFLIGGNFTFTPPCQMAKAQFIGACGVNFSFLGFEKSFDKNLWQKEQILLKSGDCPE